MPEPDDLHLLREAALAAGRVATSYAGATAARWDKPSGAGPVTEADLAVNDLLANALQTARPKYGWLSEESEDTGARLSCQNTFIVDPIDGTRSFVEGSRTWAISLAVARAGSPRAAVVYLPQRDLLFAAAAGRGATLNDRPLRVTGAATLEGSAVLAARPTLDPGHWPHGVPPIARHYRPSLAYRLALVAQGRFDGMLTLRASWEWDIAAGCLLVTEAGGRVSDRLGGALHFNNPDPRLDGVVAAAPELHSAAIAALGPPNAA